MAQAILAQAQAQDSMPQDQNWIEAAKALCDAMAGFGAAAEDPRGRSARLVQKERITQHHFKSRHRYEAIEKREMELADARIQNTMLKLEVAHLHQKLKHWDSWWVDFQMSPMHATSHVMTDVALQCCSDPHKCEVEATTEKRMTEECLDGRVHPLLVHETCTAQETALGPVAGQEDGWSEHIVCTAPSSGKPKFETDAATPCADASVAIAEDCRIACKVTGGPPALDTTLIYSDEEISLICDALIGPLAKEINRFEQVEELPVKIVADGAKHGFGKLLRDVCSKIVPLTSVLEMRRNTVHKFFAASGLPGVDSGTSYSHTSTSRSTTKPNYAEPAQSETNSGGTFSVGS